MKPNQTVTNICHLCSRTLNPGKPVQQTTTHKEEETKSWKGSNVSDALLMAHEQGSSNYSGLVSQTSRKTAGVVSGAGGRAGCCNYLGQSCLPNCRGGPGFSVGKGHSAERRCS